MLNLLNEIINGSLQPHLFGDNDIEKIEEVSNTLLTEEDISELQIFKELDFDEFSSSSTIYDNLHQIKDYDAAVKIYTETYFRPKNFKSAFYVYLISRKENIFHEKINEIINNSDDIKSIKLFAVKNIHQIKMLGHNLNRYKKTIEITTPPWENSNFIITSFISIVILRTIHFIQKTFSTFFKIEIESFENIEEQLFEKKEHVLASTLLIFPFLPDNEGFVYFKKHFIEYHSFELKNGNRISIGEALFKFYNLKYEGLNIEKRIYCYNQVIHFWEKLLITNKLKVLGENVNEPEIEKILIPLIKNEIKLLELKKQTSLLNELSSFSINNSNTEELPEATDKESILDTKPSRLEMVVSKDSYKAIMKFLVEKDLVDSESHYWKKKKGSNKGDLLALIELIGLKKHLNRELSVNDKVSIAFNTFGVKISESHAKQCPLHVEHNQWKDFPICK